MFGGSGQIGAAVLQRLTDAGWRVHAVSREQRAAHDGVRWLRGDLADMPALPAAVDAINSCGPLDHFAAWHARSAVRTARVVAFGSTSAHV